MNRNPFFLAIAMALATSSAGAVEDPNTLDVVIVTGTRASDRTESVSTSPIDIITPEMLEASGTTELATALSRVLPSLNFPRPAISDGTDAVRPAQLRGLAPDQVLVLVNGKRRNTTALINLNDTQGRGSSPVDLNAIPISSIDRIEVLRDGASAQYGSDAIAGVINIVLKGSDHGGSIAAHSEGSGRGSDFTLRLPLPPLQEDEAVRPAAELRHEAAMPASVSHLMLVDDNVDAANTLALLLELQGYTVAVEYRAQAALERAATDSPRICLLDIGLPDMDGYELARRLRAHQSTSDAILIALTGYGQAQDRERSELAGFNYHLVKPVEIDRLSALLAQVSMPAKAA